MFSQFTLWYSALATAQQVYWAIAIVATGIFLLQFVLTFAGLDGADGAAVDGFDGFDGNTLDDGGGLSLFSVRSLVNFFVGFGWAGICLGGIIPNALLLALASLVVGLCFSAMVLFIWRKVRRLEHNGAVHITDALDKTATVYLRIPEGGKGAGKVQISLGGSVHEFRATTPNEALATGTDVRVVEVNAETSTLVVEAL